jgi:hypothetical protein
MEQRGESVLGRFCHILICCGLCATTMLSIGASELALRIRPDDPIWSEPKPLPVGKLNPRKIDDAYDQLEKTFFLPGKPDEKGPPRASGTNTLGEVPDSAWYTNRHGRRRMAMDELLRGPGASRAPGANDQWTILSAKTEGVTPGFVIRDEAGRRYVLKFDTPRAPSSTTAADIIGSKIFYALGYYTPENYIVFFPREQLQIGDKATITDITGAKRRMTTYDVDKLLTQVYRREDGRYRALASLYVEGEILGPWLYHGTRSDDPNDIYPHQHRRDVRGLYVFAAWLNHYDATSLNTLDTVIEENGARFVRHYLIDFGSILGSSGVGARDPRNGFVYQYDFGFAWKEALTLGLYAPKWQRVDYPDLPEAGRFESEAFDPMNWKPIYPNPAFINCLPEDAYWAAKQVMSFTDEDIRNIVALGQYEDAASAGHLTRMLIERRNKIGRAFLTAVPSLDGFAVVNGSLTFEDLAAKYAFSQPAPVTAEWFAYDRSSLASAGLRLPPALQAAARGTIAIATLKQAGWPANRKVDVYIRKEQGARWDVVGVQRSW